MHFIKPPRPLVQSGGNKRLVESAVRPLPHTCIITGLVFRALLSDAYCRYKPGHLALPHSSIVNAKSLCTLERLTLAAALSVGTHLLFLFFFYL